MSSSTTPFKMHKLGVRYRPPTLFLFYTDTSTGKLRRRTVQLDDFNKTTDINSYANKLHQDKTNKKRSLFQYIPIRRIERILFVLKEGQTSNLTKTEIEKKLQKFDGVDENEDLNKLEDDELQHKKVIMNEIFDKNRIDPSSKEFVYDVNVDFEPDVEKSKANEWDSSEEIEEDFEKDKDDDSDIDDEDDDFK